MVESLADLRTLERFEEEQDESGIKYGKSTGLLFDLILYVPSTIFQL